MLTEILVFVLTTLIAYVIYVHKRIHWKFDKYGVKYSPGYPFFGNILKSFLMKQHISDIWNDFYNAFPNERYFGYIEGMTPIIMIRDPELIKDITVKDFDHFVDHRVMFPKEIEPLFGQSIFMMKGERWRDMRMTLTPAFTGSKMRMMMPFMTETSQNVVRYLQEHQNEEIDIPDLVCRYTVDVIASALYGIQIDSVNDQNNQFYKTTQKLFKFGPWERLKFLIMLFYPSLLKMFNLSLFAKEAVGFFENLVSNTMKQREKNNIYRPDLIQLLMDASKGKLEHSPDEEKDDIGYATVEEHLKSDKTTEITDWTQTELTSQIFGFFFAGFEITTSLLSFVVHELTIHPEVQEKAHQEIAQFNKTEGALTYDNIRQLKYLDGIFNESLRKWAPSLLDRTCTKAYELPPAQEGGKAYPMVPGDIVYSAMSSLQYDPQYFPEPDKFKPERFLDENKDEIKPFTFMPFGSGPRNCFGSRFAILEAKVFLYYLLTNFKIVKCARTLDPLMRAPSEFNQRAVGGTWVRVEARR